MSDLDTAQAQLDEKETELAAVREEYNKAMSERQVINGYETYEFISFFAVADKFIIW